MQKVDCRSGKDSGARKVGEFWKGDMLDVLGDIVENRDGVSMLQVLSRPRKGTGKDTVRGGWVPVAPKNVSIRNEKKRYLRKIGEEQEQDELRGK